MSPSAALVRRLRPAARFSSLVTCLAVLALLAAALPGQALGQDGPASADLSAALSSAPNPLRPGAPVTYTLVVANNGPDPVAGARVVDSVPAAVLGVTWTCAVNGAGGCARGGGSGNRIDTAVSLGPGASATYTIVGVLSQSVAGSLENLAAVRPPPDADDRAEENNTARSVTPVLAVADLELTRAILSPPDQVVAGGLVDLLVELRNRGPARADATVADRLPPGLTFVGASLSKGVYSATSAAWEIGALTPGEVARLVVRARWDGTPAVASSQVASASLPDPDSRPNNGVPDEDDQASVALPVALADLELTKTAAAPARNVGANAVFTLALTNRGPAAATGVRVSDQLPPGLAFVSATASQGDYDPVSGEWSLGGLGAGETATLALAATLLDAGPFTSVAQVSAADQADLDSRPGNDDPTEDDQAAVSVRGLLADLALSHGVDDPQPEVGGRVVFTLRATNEGPSLAGGVVVRDRLPLGLAFVSATPSQGAYDAATGRWAVGAIPAGGFATLQLAADYSGGAVAADAEIVAVAQPDPDSTPDNGDADEDDQAAVAIGAARADLELRQSASEAAPPVNGQVTFTLVVENKGPARATAVQVAAALPAGLAYVSHSAGQGSYNPADRRWRVGGLEAGATAQLQLRARVAGVGPYTSAAQVIKADQFDPDSTPNNGVEAEDDQASATVAPELADLSVSVAADPPVAPTSGEVTFRIGVRNDGHSPATGVALADRLTAEVARLAGEPSRGSYDLAAGAWTVGELAAGETATLALRVRVGGPGPYVAAVEVTAADQGDPDSAPGNDNPREDDQASATAFRIPPQDALVDLALRQQALSVEGLENGVAYVIEVANGGPLTASGVEVLDRLPAGAAFVSAAPSQGRYDPARGVWGVGRLAPNGRATLTILATRTGDAPLTNVAQVSRADQPDADSAPNNDLEAEDDQESVTGLTPLELRSFDAERQPPTVVRLVWLTRFEQELAGFHLFRSTDGTRASAERLTGAPVAARGGRRAGATYEFYDNRVNPFVTYSYWLVGVGGATEPEFGPFTAPGLEVRARLYLPGLP